MAFLGKLLPYLLDWLLKKAGQVIAKIFRYKKIEKKNEEVKEAVEKAVTREENKDAADKLIDNF